MTLVRDWSGTEMGSVKATAIADAVACTDPIDFAHWLAPFPAAADPERVATLVAHDEAAASDITSQLGAAALD